MKVAIVSDVHANLEALTAVLRDIETRNAEKIFFLGDAVGYGADPNKCVELLDDICEIKLLGNHDYVALGLESACNFNPMAQKSILWTQEELSQETVERLSNFELEATFLDYYFVHATPENPAEWNYMLSPFEAACNFELFSQAICFVGHSHMPAVFSLRPDDTVSMREADGILSMEKDCRYIINVGSVGQPRDGDRDASYVMVDTDAGTCDFCRVAYDLDTAQEKMRAAQLPEYLISRLANGK